MSNQCDVFVIDDEQELVEIYLEYFKDAGLSANGSRMPWEALHMLSNLSPRILIVDNQMPGLMGLDLLEAGRKSGIDIPPTIMATAYGDVNLERACEVGVGVVLQKPFRVERLVSLVRGAIGNRTYSEHRRWIRINSTLKVKIEGHDVRLTDLGIGGCSIDLMGDELPATGVQRMEIRTKTLGVIQISVIPKWNCSQKVGLQFDSPSIDTQMKMLQLVSSLAQENRLEI